MQGCRLKNSNWKTEAKSGICKMSKTWRDMARPLIVQVLKESEGKSEKEIRKALKDAYPWGERRYHPYKIWLDEIKVQRKGRQFGKKNNIAPKEQISLF